MNAAADLQSRKRGMRHLPEKNVARSDRASPSQLWRSVDLLQRIASSMMKLKPLPRSSINQSIQSGWVFDEETGFDRAGTFSDLGMVLQILGLGPSTLGVTKNISVKKTDMEGNFFYKLFLFHRNVHEILEIVKNLIGDCLEKFFYISLIQIFDTGHERKLFTRTGNRKQHHFFINKIIVMQFTEHNDLQRFDGTSS